MSHRNGSPRRSDGTRSTTDSPLERRRILLAGAAAALPAVAGCLSDDGPAAGAGDSSDGGESGSGGGDESDGGDADSGDGDADSGDGEENPDDGEEDRGDGDDGDGEADSDEPSGPLEALDAYLAAAAAEDVDAIGEIAHGSSPFHPAAWEEEGWEFRGGGEGIDAEDYDADVLTEDGSVDDVLELESAEFWFEEDELEAEIGDETIALVELAPVDADATSTWAVVTEAGEWRVLFGSEEDDAPDDPEEAFGEEVLDEDGDVVEEIDWSFEQDAGGDEDGPFGDVEWAQVVLTDDPGLEADRVVIESTIEGSEFELSGEGPNAWADSYANVAFDPDGDQIVVTAVGDGEETVVHRERSP